MARLAAYALVLAVLAVLAGAAVALLWLLRREPYGDAQGTCPDPYTWFDSRTKGCRGPQHCLDLGGALVATADARGKTRYSCDMPK